MITVAPEEDLTDALLAECEVQMVAGKSGVVEFWGRPVTMEDAPEVDVSPRNIAADLSQWLEPDDSPPERLVGRIVAYYDDLPYDIPIAFSLCRYETEGTAHYTVSLL